ncbi:MAG: adenine phosphoribosyltransferase [Desulfocapsaceae bacterium]|jgi:adenine phosphoribosyltransferase|nr:adenine phosphoribosyltransferase [Desulfocapsaceae bacterium]
MEIDGFDLTSHIRSVPGWPEPHVVFRDICSLLEDRFVFKKMIDLFVHRYSTAEIDAVVGIDARGFIIGAPLAYQLNVSFIPLRKKGKLPGETISEAYALEYGQAEIEVQTAWLKRGHKVVLVDDLIATGGTMVAAVKLLNRIGVDIVEASAIIDLPDLGGSRKIVEHGISVHSFCDFDGD